MRTPSQEGAGALRPWWAFGIVVCVAAVGTVAALQGQAGRFVDGGQVVRDTKTNLMWEKKDNAGGLNDVDNTYGWCEATGTTEKTDILCKENSRSWIGELNAKGFAGFKDWRVPTRDELAAIVDASAPKCGMGAPCIDPAFGPTKAFGYWASTEQRRTSRGSVNFYTGTPGVDSQSNPFHVRAVRNQ
jgi:hypothetical protein